MASRFVRLGDGRPVRLAAYVAAWRLCRSLPSAALVRGSLAGPLSCQVDSTAGRELAEFRRGLHARINRHDPAHGRGRKWCEQWQADAMRTARAINTPRLLVRWAPAEFRARLAARLCADGPMA